MAQYKPHDHFFKKARRQGYRSRAAYKLLELNKRYRLIKRGGRVVDLGCSPGGFMQVALEAAGERGRVVGIDINPMQPIAHPAAVFIQADVASGGLSGRVIESLGGRKADCLLSDMAPATSGIADADQFRSLELARHAVALAEDVLRTGGNLLVKVFDSEGVATLVSSLRGRYKTVLRRRPSATRKGSRELYIIAIGKLPTP